MKKIVLTVLCCIFALSMVAADEYPYMAFRTSDGNLRVMAIENMNLTIVDGKLAVSNLTENETFALNNLTEMFFAADLSGINSVEVNADSSVEVFSMSGISLGIFDTKASALTTLPSGIYIARYNNGITEKIVVK